MFYEGMKSQRVNPPLKVGILGGGQLARMMALAAPPLGLQTWILSANSDDPAAQVSPYWMQGNPNKKKDLLKFFKKVDVVTYESEFFDAELLHEVQKETKINVFPRPKKMALLQDRWPQKKLYEKYKLPTSPFCLIRKSSDLERCHKEWSSFVLKKRRFGYDGYGTYIVRDKKALEQAHSLIAKDPQSFIAEKFIPFDREIALMVARSRGGETVFFPWVETFQEDSRCLWVKGPLQPTPAMRSLQKRLQNFLEGIGYIGVMGVELFDAQGRLMVNEIAPRVHNSGHYSQDALSEDQFVTHLKSITGHSIMNPKVLSPFAMLNLLGGKRASTLSWQTPPGIQLHWYGKNESRPGRKMGHINAQAKTADQALKELMQLRGHFKV